MKKVFFFAILLIINVLPKISAQNFTSSDLPILLIDTKGVDIPDSPKNPATLTIINNGKGKRNTLTDKPAFFGTMGIEIRGSSSQIFPKKGFGIEIQDANGNSVDTTLFGMSKDNDWVLFASYNEKSFMHNNLTMSLAREMGIYGSRTQYVEVFLNGQYWGLYVFMEKIKRNKARVDIANLKITDLTGDQITGGYIIKIDKTTGSNEGGWNSKYYNPTNPDTKKRTFFLYEAPKGIQPAQQNYIHAFVDSLDDAMTAPTFADVNKGYRKFLDTKSFVKYLIISEVTKAVDAYRYSTYFNKDKKSKGGKLKAGPPWDYDIAYGNADYYDGWKYQGFAYDFNKISGTNGDAGQPHFWWQKMITDPAFVAEVGTEYSAQRKTGALKNENITAHIDSLFLEIQEAQVRNFQKWKILGTYVWPNHQPVPATWEGEVGDFRYWINTRMLWLDVNMPGIVLATEQENELPQITMEAYPNPFIESVSVKIHAEKNEKATLSLLDISGKILTEKAENLQVGENVFNLQTPDYQAISNVSILRLQIGEKVLVKKLVRQ